MRKDLAPDPLITRIAMGDHDAFATFYENEGPWIYTLAGRFLGQQSDIEEAVAQAFDFFWDQVTETGHPDISTHAWLVWLIREHALEAISEAGAAPAPDHWLPLEGGSRFGKAFAKLPPEAARLILRAWRAGATDPSLREPQTMTQLRGSLTLLAQKLPKKFSDEARGDGGPDLALDLFGLLDGEDHDRLYNWLSVTPSLQIARREWAEALAELADAPSSLPLPKAHNLPPDEIEDKVMAYTQEPGVVRQWIRDLDLIPLTIGSFVAAFFAWGVYQFGTLDLRPAAPVQYAHLQTSPTGPEWFQATYTPSERNLMIRPLMPEAQAGVIWLRIGAAEPVRLGVADPAQILNLRVPDDIADDLAGARLTLRALDGTLLADGRLHTD